MTKQQTGVGKEPFPWHLGVFDAHCHPTDTVPSIDSIAAMKTKVLTIMATRRQDQHLVADFADQLGIASEDLPDSQDAEPAQQSPQLRGRLVPCFGWHPWFSHQIYDDYDFDQGRGQKAPRKSEHYLGVISPPPRNEDDFIASLPDPQPLSGLINQTRAYLERYPFALIGEIGLDRAFRIPGLQMTDKGHDCDPALTPGGREGRRLSPYRVDVDHQKRILKCQLNLAGEMQRAVSVHGVAAHGMLFETLQDTWRGFENPVLSKRERKRKGRIDVALEGLEGGEQPEEQSSWRNSPRPFPPRICLHSYSGPPDTLKQYLHPSIPTVVFFSFSHLVNFSSSTSNKAVAVIRTVPDDRILAESDLHAAGEKMDGLLEEIVRTICEIKEWTLRDGLKQLASNWMHFVFGNNMNFKFVG